MGQSSIIVKTGRADLMGREKETQKKRHDSVEYSIFFFFLATHPENMQREDLGPVQDRFYSPARPICYIDWLSIKYISLADLLV